MDLDVCLCVLVVITPALTWSPVRTDWHDSDVTSFAVALLKRTTPVTSKINGAVNVKIYKTSGGPRQAQKDFDSLKPTGIKTSWGLKSGKVGDWNIEFLDDRMLSISRDKRLGKDGRTRPVRRIIAYED